MARINDGRPIFQKGQETAKRSKPSKSLRSSAKGQDCTLRLSCCNYDPETTVLCHIRKFGWAGMAQKPLDLLAVFACSDCHDALDKRRNDMVVSDTEVLRALGQTIMVQVHNGNVGF